MPISNISINEMLIEQEIKVNGYELMIRINDLSGSYFEYKDGKYI